MDSQRANLCKSHTIAWFTFLAPFQNGMVGFKKWTFHDLSAFLWIFHCLHLGPHIYCGREMYFISELSLIGYTGQCADTLPECLDWTYITLWIIFLTQRAILRNLTASSFCYPVILGMNFLIVDLSAKLICYSVHSISAENLCTQLKPKGWNPGWYPQKISIFSPEWN